MGKFSRSLHHQNVSKSNERVANRFLSLLFLLHRLFIIKRFFMNNSQIHRRRNKSKINSLLSILCLLIISVAAEDQETEEMTIDKIQFKDSSPIHFPRRKQMGSPHKSQSLLQIHLITPLSKRQSKQNSKCIVINGASFISFQSLESSFKLVSSVGKVIILGNSRDKSSKAFIGKYFKKQQFRISSQILIPDSNFKFIQKSVQGCQKILYIQANTFLFNTQPVLQIMDKIQKYQCYYSSNILQYETKASLPLKELNTTNLYQLSALQLARYIFIFDAQYLSITTPLNFAFYNKYTIDEMIIVPILAILQLSEKLIGFEPRHSQENNYFQNNQFTLSQAKSGSINPMLCFLSLPSNPHKFSELQTIHYLLHLVQNPQIKNHALIIYFPYSLESRDMFNAIQFLLTVSHMFSFVRLRIIWNRAPSSYAAYQSSYTYCPTDSFLVISRQNILYVPTFIQSMLYYMIPQMNYYLAHYKIKSKIQSISKSSIGSQGQAFRHQNQHYVHFRTLQVIKSEFFRCLYFWILKNDQIDFYEAEASFIFPLMEISNSSFMVIEQPIIIVLDRNVTTQEEFEIENLKKYYRWPYPGDTILRPYKHNALSNIAFRRNAPQKIPKKIHQIWLGNQQISPLRIKLKQTLLQKNKDYSYKLWTQQDLTLQNFPYTYSLITKFQDAQQFNTRNMLAGVADLMRLQILLREGGIYLDFKAQGLKPLDSFLKYQILFNDMDYSREGYGAPLYVGNTFMGAAPNSYFINLMLTQIIVEVNPFFEKLPKTTGALKIRQAFNEHELFTVPGFGFQLTSQRPNSDRPLRCSKPQKLYPDQQIFQITFLGQNSTNQFGIPCHQYPQSYLVMYKQLGRTWKL